MGNFLSIPGEYVRPMPTSLNFEAASTLPYAGMVAWQLLVASGGLEPGKCEGKRVFLWGGIRGVERLVIQLLKM